MIVVIGATGNIGKHLVTELTTRDQPVRVVSRDVQRARQALPGTIEFVQADLTQPADVQHALRGASSVYLATNGPDQLAAETNVINHARAAAVRRIVRVSVIGASPDHFVSIARVHYQLDQLLAASGVSYTTLRPNWFMENFLGSRDSIRAQSTFYGSAADGRIAFIDSRDTAAVAVRALTEDGHDGKDYHLTGPAALTFAAAADQLSAGVGRQITYVNLSDADFGGALTSAGVPAPFVTLMLEINRNAREQHLAAVTQTVETITGAPARSLASFARNHAEVFAAARP